MKNRLSLFTVLFVLIFMNSVMIYSLDLQQLNLAELPKGAYLSYEISSYKVDNENGVKETSPTPAKLIEVYSMETTESKDGVDYRWYEISMVSENKEKTFLKFMTDNGGKSIVKAALKLPNGAQSMLDNPDKIQDVKLFEAMDLDYRDIGEKKLMKIGSKSFMGNLIKGEKKLEPFEIENGGLVLRTLTRVEEEYWKSESKDLPVMLEHKKTSFTEKYAFPQGNEDIRFPNMNENFKQVTEIKLIQVEEKTMETNIKGLGPDK